jgi:hypothetical protein
LRGAGSLLVAGLIAVAGCKTWVPIKPVDLPRLNDAPATVQEPDGTTVEIIPPFDASISTRTQYVGFTHPVDSSVENRMLVVSGSNRGRTVFPLTDVVAVRVSQPNPDGTTALAGVFLGAAVVALIVLVITVSSSSSQ